MSLSWGTVYIILVTADRRCDTSSLKVLLIQCVFYHISVFYCIKGFSHWRKVLTPRLPDGYSHILKLSVFSPSSLKVYGSAAMLRCKIGYLLPLDCARIEGAIQVKEGFQVCHLATLYYSSCSLTAV